MEKADRLISVLGLPPGCRVLDVGCGTGEFLIQVMKATGASGLGVDQDPQSIAAARASAERRLPGGSWEFRESGINDAALEPGSFEAALCIGSTHAFAMGDAAYPKALSALGRWVRPGGKILVGEGYWKQPPAPEYLELIGEPVGIYHNHQGNIALAEQQGLIPLYAAVSSDDEWDDFEWSHRMRIEEQAAQQPGDPAVAEKLKQSRAWRDGYLRWGRSTMGFGFYLFQTRQAP